MPGEATVAVRFRILGSLAVSWDGEPLALGGERQRALLAVLLVHANELVATERLIDQLFRASQPASAANSLRVAVSRLRLALRDDHAAMILSRRGGYELALGPEQLDATIFARLLDDGRALAASGDPAAAHSRLCEALSLWRGAPLADLATVEGLQPEIRRLEELRLLAEMERIDTELALGRAREAVVELERLVAAEPLQERLRGQLMLALYRSGRQAEALAAYRDARALLHDELGLTPSPALRELEGMILRQDVRLETDLGPGAPARPVVCPFKGLAAFEASDAEFFCGRDRVLAELVARLAEWPLVGILGPSGMGKSSLLRAGVLPALRAGALPGSAHWRQVLLRPREHPCAELRRALGRDLGDLPTGPGAGGRLVVAIDQLEELFTVCHEEAERREFLERLTEAAGDHERRVLVLCALRADFYGRVSAYPEFAELLSRSHALLGPMDRGELREVIERPAARAGLEVERRLIDALVDEVVDEPGGLPLLSTTLLELWQASDGHVLRLQDYRATGGVRGGVARIAEAVYMRLSEPEQHVAQSLLLRLADLGEEAPERRRVSLAELEGLDGTTRVLAGLTEARLVTVGAGVVELSHEALLREWPRYRGWLDEDRVGRRLHSHLRVAAQEWDARRHDPADLYRGARLAAALEFCMQHPDQMDRVEREFVAASRQEADRETQRQRSQNRRLRALLVGAAVLLILTVIAGAVAIIRQRQASANAKLAVAEAHAALGRQLGAEALGEPRLDVAALLAREAVALDRSPQTEGTLLSTLLRNPAVAATFSLPANSAPQVSVSPDGRTLAVSDSVDDRVRFYDIHSRARGATALGDFLGDQPPVYSGDGSLLVYPDGPSLVVRDGRTLALRTRLPIGSPFSQDLTADVPSGSILIAPDRRSVYYAYWLVNPAGQAVDAYLSRWSLPSGEQLPTVSLGSGPLLALRLIDRGAGLMVVRAHRVATYDAHSLRLVRAETLRPAPLRPSTAAISPDGASVAIGSETGAVWFVNAATGAARRGLAAHAAAVASIVYAPSDETVVTIGDDGKVITWDPKTRTETALVSGPAGHVREATVSPDGTTLYTAAVGGVLLAWDLTGRRSFGHRARLHSGLPCCDPLSPPEPALALSPNGSRFAVAIGASTVGVFSAETFQRQALFTITPTGEPITALAWSPNGAVLAVGAHAGVVELWGMHGAPRLERALAGLAVLPRRSEAIQSLAFSPNSQLLSATAKSQPSALGHAFTAPFATMAIWRVRTGDLAEPPAELGAGDGLGGSDVAAFSRDGKLLAVTLLIGGVRLIEPSTGRSIRTLADPGSDSISVAFAPDGKLAAGTLGGTVELWNPATGRRLAPPLLADSAPITSLAFDAGGQRFATTGYQDGTIRVWFTASLQQEGPRLVSDPGATTTATFVPGAADVLAVDDRGDAFTWPASLSAWEQRACSLAGRLTSAAWAELVDGPGYATVCR
jgi:DNA-binding SARP family transcriptional activator/WD40 repeat protein